MIFSDLHQGRLCILFFIFTIIQSNSAYEQSLTRWFCSKPNPADSSVETFQTVASCSSGYVIDIDDVVYESTIDGECSGQRLCSLHSKNTLTFTCNRKRLCSLKIQQLHFYINSTCQTANRFYIKYRCLPVIQTEKQYQCDSSTRGGPSTTIHLSCENFFRLYIKMALVGVSTQQSSSLCDKNTYWLCNHYVPDAYRNVCNNRLSYTSGSQCDIHYNDRPRLKACPHGEYSNFSMIEYLCIPGEGITNDLPRIDICANDDTEYLSINRGLLQSPHYPYSLGTYLSCKKRLQIPHESHIRFFMLEKSIEYSHQMHIRLLTTEPNIQRTLNKNEYFETNLTSETIEFVLKTNHVGEGKFLLYFQVDSRISEHAPMTLESERQHDDMSRRKQTSIKREWGVVIGCLIGLLLVVLLIVIVLLLVRFSKRRRAQSLRYMKAANESHQHVNEHHQSKRGIKIEHPHLRSSTTILGPTNNNDNRSDCESLLKQSHQSANQNFDMNTYLQPNTSSSQPIRDHNEVFYYDYHRC